MSCGLVTIASCGWRCVIGIGGAVSWGLLSRASSGWRRVLGFADQGLVWVAPCHVMSRRVHVTSPHTSRRVMSCVSQQGTSRNVTSCHVFVASHHFASRHIVSRLVTSGHVMSRHVESRHVVSRCVMPRRVASCHAMSVAWHVRSCDVK